MSDMRDDLSAALDLTAEGDETQNYEETPQEIDFDEIDDLEVSEIEEAEIIEETYDAAATEEVEEEQPHGDSIKAPIDWGPQDRESWSKIPRHLQEKVMSREKELNTMLQTTADARKTHEQMGHLSTKYGAALAGAGVGNNPLEAADMLFSTVSNLRMGSPIQKAQIIADMISSFGVDVSVLDSALVGAAPPPEQQQNHTIEQMINQRLAPFEQQMGQQRSLQQQQEQQGRESAMSEVQQFSQQAEFLNDVRHDMADFIDMAAKNGQELTIEQAYQKACVLNPQIQSVLQKRADTARITGASNDMASKRTASSSIVGDRIGGGSNGAAGSMRDTLSSAWDMQGKI